MIAIIFLVRIRQRAGLQIVSFRSVERLSCEIRQLVVDYYAASDRKRSPISPKFWVSLSRAHNDTESRFSCIVFISAITCINKQGDTFSSVEWRPVDFKHSMTRYLNATQTAQWFQFHMLQYFDYSLC